MRLTKEREEQIRNYPTPVHPDYGWEFDVILKELLSEIEGLRAEMKDLDNDFWKIVKGKEIIVKSLEKERDKLKTENDHLVHTGNQLAKGNLKLQERVAVLREFLQEKSKRSNYIWSFGGQYLADDCLNEGQIQCAEEALAVDDELEKK